MDMKIEGTDDLMRQLAALVGDYLDAADDATGDIAAELEAGVVLRIQQGPKTGALYYYISNGNGTYSIFANDSEGYVGTFEGEGRASTHQASAAGESPASDMGALVGGMYSERVKPLLWIAGNRMEYAPHLEFGTVNMAARPAWTPEIEEMQPEYIKRMTQLLNGVTP